MQDDKDGPLSSTELEKDRQRAGTSLEPEDAPGHSLPAIESDDAREGGHGPNPIGGTMLPPD